MLSIAIKNTILMVLIILIFHFLIKNYLFERSLTQVQQQSFTETTTSKPETKQSIETKPPSEAPAVCVNKAKPVPADIANTKSKEDDLLRFVFENTLEDTKSDVTEKLISAPNTVIPFQTSGDTSGISPVTTQVVKVDSSPPIEDPVACGKNSFSVINEYENECVMNGGQLFQGISGYDGPNQNFTSLDSFFVQPLS
jgi:hypothetical protein